MSVFFCGRVTVDGYLADRNHGLEQLHESGAPEEPGRLGGGGPAACGSGQPDVCLSGRSVL